jgi:hypothetical protein
MGCSRTLFGVRGDIPQQAVLEQLRVQHGNALEA